MRSTLLGEHPSLGVREWLRCKCEIIGVTPQAKLGIKDTPDIFEADTLKSAPGAGATDVPAHTPPLAKVLNLAALATLCHLAARLPRRGLSPAARLPNREVVGGLAVDVGPLTQHGGRQLRRSPPLPALPHAWPRLSCHARGLATLTPRLLG